MINTRATLWFNIVLDFLPSQHDGFRCHSFTIRDALALKVFKRLKLNILSLFTGVPHTWPARYISAGHLSPSGRGSGSYQDCSSHTLSYIPIFTIKCPGGHMGGDRHIPPCELLSC